MAKQHHITKLIRDILSKFFTLGTPMSSHIPLECALSTSLRFGAAINWRVKLEAPSRSVLRILITRWIPLSHDLTEVQSPWCNVTTSSDMPLNLNRATPNNTKLMMQMSPAVAKQVHNTTCRRLLQVRQLLERECSGLTSGNHGVSSLSEQNVTSCNCDRTSKPDCNSKAESATKDSSSSEPSEMAGDCSWRCSRAEEYGRISLEKI